MTRVNYFEFLTSDDYAVCKDATVFLDVDHTLLPPNSDVITESVREVVQNIQRVAKKIYLTSNGGNHVRNREIGKECNVSYIESVYKKPSTRLIKDIPETPPFVVIGDKLLTDGLFAKNIGGVFIQVKRYHGDGEPLFDRLACFIDDMLGGIVR